MPFPILIPLPMPCAIFPNFAYFAANNAPFTANPKSGKMDCEKLIKEIKRINLTITPLIIIKKEAKGVN